MSIGGISGGNGFLQVNNAINQLGEQKASMLTQRGKAITDVSNFGNETKHGHSAFQQANEKVLNTGEQKTSMLSGRGRAIMNVSNFGNEVKIGKGKFQNLQNQVANEGQSSVSAAMRSAKQAYNKGRAPMGKGGVDLSE